eukprot:2351898-Amphidinium_carterae.1
MGESAKATEHLWDRTDWGKGSFACSNSPRRPQEKQLESKLSQDKRTYTIPSSKSAGFAEVLAIDGRLVFGLWLWCELPINNAVIVQVPPRTS